jgi:hypothetical protein
MVGEVLDRRVEELGSQNRDADHGDEGPPHGFEVTDAQRYENAHQHEDLNPEGTLRSISGRESSECKLKSRRQRLVLVWVHGTASYVTPRKKAILADLRAPPSNTQAASPKNRAPICLPYFSVNCRNDH